MKCVPSLALAVLLCGCATTGQAPNPTRMANSAEIAAFTGISIDLTHNPEHRIYYYACLQTLTVLVEREQFDPAEFVRTLQKLPIKELKSQDAAIIIGSTILLWDQYAADVVNMDRRVYVKPVMQGVRRGISRALETVPQPPPP